MRSRADADEKGLPQLAAEAAKSPSGELSVKLGEVYYGFGDYQKAIDAINQGLQKGQVKHLEEAYVYLARADAGLQNNADARRALDGLRLVPNVSPRILKLWSLYSATLGTPPRSAVSLARVE
jgi:tetratricopeptide (TPR) repeat protein